MLCPVCNSDMIDVEHNRIELDYCIKCQGVWFDAEELDLLLGSMGFESHGLPPDDILHATEAETSEKKRKCPICSLKMKKMALGKQSEILIDACPQGDGLWFDGGEVGQLIKQLVKKPAGKGDTEQQVVTFLGETFKARE